MSYRYPYGNTEQMNLDWFLNQWEKFKADWAEAEAGIDGSLDAEIAKVEAAMSELYAARDAAAASASAARQSSLDAAAAQVAAGNSKTAAQAAETSARGSQQAAAQSAQEAQASAQGAENSALTASQAANTATQQAAGADAAKGAAEAAQQAAEAAQAAAAQSAGQAGQAAQDMSDSVAQITTNKNDISDLKKSISGLEYPFSFDGNINTTGDINTGTAGTYKCTDFIFVGEGCTLFAIDIISRDWAPAYTWYNYNKEKISNSGVSNGTYLITEIPEDAVYVRFSSNVQNDNNPRVFSCSQKTIEAQIINKTSVSNNIAARGTEQNNIAPKNLIVNDFVIIGATLYRVTQNVAQGLNLAEGINIRKTSIGEELTALINA